LCHLSSTPVVNALFESILQCVSRYAATGLDTTAHDQLDKRLLLINRAFIRPSWHYCHRQQHLHHPQSMIVISWDR